MAFYANVHVAHGMPSWHIMNLVLVVHGMPSWHIMNTRTPSPRHSLMAYHELVPVAHGMQQLNTGHHLSLVLVAANGEEDVAPGHLEARPNNCLCVHQPIDKCAWGQIYL